MKFEGGGVVAELTKILQGKPNDPVIYHDNVASLTAPSGWFVTQVGTGDLGSVGRALNLVVFDPNAVTVSRVRVDQLDSLSQDARKSVRAWAEEKMADAAKVNKDFKVRSNAWKELTVDGRPAVSFVADSVQDDQKKILRGIYVFSDSSAAELLFTANAADFATFSPQFDTIVESFKMK